MGVRADGGRMGGRGIGGRGADRQTACRMEADGQTSEQAYESGRNTDRAD